MQTYFKRTSDNIFLEIKIISWQYLFGIYVLANISLAWWRAAWKIASISTEINDVWGGGGIWNSSQAVRLIPSSTLEALVYV